jgi:hypothetical protein
MIFQQPIRLVLYGSLLLLLLAGCGGGPRGYLPEEASPPPYLPPTPAVPTDTATPAMTDTPEPLRPSPTPPCSPNLSFVDDLTIPDGANVRPGDRLDKRWLVENSGACNWDENYRIRLIAGPNLGAQTEQALYPARSGTQATLRIEFTAPAEAGVYRSAWQAYDPRGVAFGDLFFIEFVVLSPISP